MIRVTLVPQVQTGRMNGVTRYSLGIISSDDLTSRGIDLRILCQGREIPATEWLKSFSSLGRAPRWACKLNETILYSLALYRSKADVIHYPLGWLPQGWTMGSASRVVTLHGAARLTGPWHSTPTRAGKRLQKQLRGGAVYVARFITGSQWSKEEIVEAFGLRPERVSVIPYGVDLARFRPLENRAEVLARLKTMYAIEDPYLLHVGPSSPRKNVLRLVQAFGHLKQRYHIPHRLVFSGAPGRMYAKVTDEVSRQSLTDDVVLTGPVDDDVLVRLYNGASVFVFPSLYEGFGFPVLEAMACGTPVVTSNCTALPETAGGAAALVDDPTDVENIVAVIQQVLDDTAYRESLRQRGLAWAQAFSWEACAMAHLELYRRVVEECG